MWDRGPAVHCYIPPGPAKAFVDTKTCDYVLRS
jgi:hypothetical protein